MEGLDLADIEALQRLLRNDKFQGLIDLESLQKANHAAASTSTAPKTTTQAQRPHNLVNSSMSPPNSSGKPGSQAAEIETPSAARKAQTLQQTRKHPRSLTKETDTANDDFIQPNPKIPRNGTATRGTTSKNGRGNVAKTTSSRSNLSSVTNNSTSTGNSRSLPVHSGFLGDGGAAQMSAGPSKAGTVQDKPLNYLVSPSLQHSRENSVRPRGFKSSGIINLMDGNHGESSNIRSTAPLLTPTVTSQPCKSVTGTPSTLPSLKLNIAKNASPMAGRGRSETLANNTPPPLPHRRFVIGLDYGTTFTSVSYTSHPVGQPNPHILPNDVKTIKNWPGDGNGGVREQVPTEVWYGMKPFGRVLDSALDTDDDEDNASSESEVPQSRTSRAPPEPPQQTEDARHDKQDTINISGPDFLWGYEVLNHFYYSSSKRSKLRRVERPKLMLVGTELMLVGTEHTESDRERLGPRLDHLIHFAFIRKYERDQTIGKRDVEDAILDFLTKVLEHTKLQLIELENFTDDCLVHFALTVPSIWSHESSRIMQSSLEKAMKATDFGTLSVGGSIDDLFIVSEPEAGATYVMALKPRTMIAGDTFTFMDCGGGTVDLVTYTATRSYPLRLETEVGKSTGDACGAGYLNDRFEQLLCNRLKDDLYLEQNGQSIADIARRTVPFFENFIKREVDIHRRPTREIHIPGLKGDEGRGLSGINAKRFEDSCLPLDVHDFNYIFQPVLERVERLLRGQLEAAIAEKREVKKVFMIGSSLCGFVDEFRLPYDIELQDMNPQRSVIAIASGAVLRAMDLTHGPARKAFSNYGFRQRERYDPMRKPGHRGATPIIDEHDGLEYVEVINYFMLKGNVLSARHRFPPHKCIHTFGLDEELRCRDTILFNDSDTKSSFFRDHPINQDAEVAKRIKTNLTFLKNEKRIRPTHPTADRDGVTKGKLHYKIEYELTIIVEARNLRYESRYPCGSKGTVFQKGQVCIASAFQAGTG